MRRAKSSQSKKAKVSMHVFRVLSTCTLVTRSLALAEVPPDCNRSQSAARLLLTCMCGELKLSSEQSRSNQSKSEGGGLISPEISGSPCDGVLIFIRRRETEAGTETEMGRGGQIRGCSNSYLSS